MEITIYHEKIYKAGLSRARGSTGQLFVVAEGVDKAGFANVGFANYRNLRACFFRVCAAQGYACFKFRLLDGKLHTYILSISFALCIVSAPGP